MSVDDARMDMLKGGLMHFKLIVVNGDMTHPYWDEFFATLEEARKRRDEVNKDGVKVAILGMRAGLVA